MFKILIVDDESTDRKGIEFLIHKFEFPLECKQAGSAQEALSLLERETFHILFTDIQMPKMDGLVLIEKALERQPHLKVIIFSAHGSFEYAKTAMLMGVKWYLLKPIVLQDFRQVIRETLEDCGKIERENAQNSVLRLLHTGKAIELPEWPYGSGLLLAGFDEPAVAAKPREIEAAADKAAGNAPLFVQINEYECLIFTGEDDLEEKAARLRRELCAANLDGTTIVIGNMRRFEELPDLYAQMNTCLDYRFFSEDNVILRVKKEEKRSAGREKSIDTLEREILFYFRRRDKAQVEKKLGELFANGSWSQSEMLMKYLATNIARECLHMSNKDDQAVSRCLERLLKCRSVRDTQKILKNLVDEAFADCISDGKKAVVQLLEVIERDYSREISLDSLAESIHLTPSYLSFLFKQETGQNFIKYLTNYRLEKAKKLLQAQNFKINMIAEMVGYTNVSYFCQIFKNTYGITPMQYKERYHSEPDEG